MIGFLVFCLIDVFIMTQSVGGLLHMKMPGVRPKYDDTYLCTHIRLEKTIHIIGFEPDANMKIAHHMILFKCKAPLSKEKFYPCRMGCIGEGIIFAWARQAKGLHLPNNVAFEVGKSTGYNYLALQVHYLKRMKTSDTSGVRILTTPKPQPNLADIMLLLANDGTIRPNRRRVFLRFGCTYKDKTAIYPFAFRTHAHTLGRVIFAYWYPRRQTSKPTLIGRASPQWPQAFYNASFYNAIRYGDKIVGACIYNSSQRHRVTEIGSSHNDEMCNFYMMFYRKREDKAPSDSHLLACEDVNMNRRLYRRLWKKIPRKTFKELPTTLSALKKSEIYNFQLTHWSVQYSALGQVSGVSVDSKGRLYVFHRADRTWDFNTFDSKNRIKDALKIGPITHPTILIVDRQSGHVMKTFGKNMFYMPHGITVDLNDNVWVTDVGLHQVFKYNAGEFSKPVLRLGTRLTPGSGAKHFCKPTDVSVLKSGDILVADGYCNARVAHFSSAGKFLGEWHSADGSFEIPHSITLVNNSLACVADRERARIECFSTRAGTSLFTFKDKSAFGDAVYAITTSHEKGQQVIHGVIRRTKGPKGFSMSFPDGRILSKWGSDGLKQPHDLSVVSNELYAAELEKPYRVVSFMYNSPNKHENAASQPKSHSGSIKVTKEQKNNVTVVTESKRGDSVNSTYSSQPEVDLVTSTDKKNDSSISTVFISKGFMNLLSDNAPFLIAVIIVVPLATIVLGAVIARLHRSGLCVCPCCRSGPRIRRDRDRGRFQPLLDEDDDSDNEDTIMERKVNGLPSVMKSSDLKT